MPAHAELALAPLCSTLPSLPSLRPRTHLYMRQPKPRQAGRASAAEAACSARHTPAAAAAPPLLPR